MPEQVIPVLRFELGIFAGSLGPEPEGRQKGAHRPDEYSHNITLDELPLLDALGFFGTRRSRISTSMLRRGGPMNCAP